MKVKDLIEKLKEFPDDITVSVARYDCKYVDDVFVYPVDVWLRSHGGEVEGEPHVHGDASESPYGWKLRKDEIEERILVCNWKENQDRFKEQRDILKWRIDSVETGMDDRLTINTNDCISIFKAFNFIYEETGALSENQKIMAEKLLRMVHGLPERLINMWINRS